METMKRLCNSYLLAFLLSMVLFFNVQAQSDTLTISLRRDFGYSSGGADIQGLFSITASGPANLGSVSFYVDKTLVGTVSQAPFRLQFNTDNYPLGQHQIFALGQTRNGNQLKSQVVTANFVSAGAAGQAAMKIAVPILGITLLAVFLSAVVPLLTGRKTREFPAGGTFSYPLGGAVCPKCERPFAIHIYGLNMLTHKFDRCPYCGKWSMVKYASSEKLRAAEQAQLARANEKSQVPEASAEDKLKKELDDSKYHEM